MAPPSRSGDAFSGRKNNQEVRFHRKGDLGSDRIKFWMKRVRRFRRKGRRMYSRTAGIFREYWRSGKDESVSRGIGLSR